MSELYPETEKVVWSVGGETLDLKLPKDIKKTLTEKPTCVAKSGKNDEKMHTFFGC